MRRWLIALVMCGVAACGPQNTTGESSEPAPPPTAFDGALVEEASAKIAHGERLTWVLGCRGCHGKNLQGERFYEAYASNLTRDLEGYSDAQFQRLMRNGAHPTGREVWGMPSELFQHLSEPDHAALLAYLRTLKPQGKPTGKMLPFEPATKQLIAEGKFKPAADFVKETTRVGPAELGEPHEFGRYITRVTCAECHGAELKGGVDTPDLVVAGAYTRAEFEDLMTKGVAPGGRKLKALMGQVAKERFTKMTPHEREAVYAYLKARSEQSQ